MWRNRNTRTKRITEQGGENESKTSCWGCSKCKAN